jgi:hypothetical protein
MKDALELMVARNLMARATDVLSSVDVPDRASACIGALALAIIQIAKTSPQDQADQVAAIAGMMRD